MVLDIDGTILDHAGGLTERIRSAVRGVANSPSHTLVLATGRAAVGVDPVWDLLGLREGYAVTSNGAAVLKYHAESHRRVLHEVTFDPAEALRSLRTELPGARFAVEDVALGFRVTEEFPPGELQGDIRIVSFDELINAPVARCIMRSPEHTAADFLALSHHLGLNGASYAVGWSAWLDISPHGVDKAYGLQRVAQELGFSANEVLAIGDGRNDLAMFSWAGSSIAMGQSEVEVQSAADAVCGPVHEDGLAEVLERLVA